MRIKAAVYPEGVKCKRETHKIRRLQKHGEGDLINAYHVSKKVLTEQCTSCARLQQSHKGPNKLPRDTYN
jgi:hypothetical protein